MQEHRYYFPMKLRAAMISWCILFIPFVLLFSLGMVAMISIEKHQVTFFTFDSSNAPLFAAIYVILLCVSQLYIQIFRSYIALTDEYIRGIKLWRIFGTFQTKMLLPFTHFNPPGWVGYGRLRYQDISRVSDKTFFGMRYREYRSRLTPRASILVFHSTKNVQECFDIINKRMRLSAYA